MPSLTAWSAALTRAGHDLTLHVPPVGRSTRAVGRFVRALTDLWRADRPDVVHLSSGFGTAAVVEAATALGVPVVYGLGEQRLDADEVAQVSAADHVVVTYDGQRRRLASAGIARGRVSVVPYGLDVDHFTPDGGTASMGPRAARRIVSVGPLVAESGFGTTVAALVALRDTELVVVGGPVNGRHAHELRAYAKTLGVADRLVLAGEVPDAAMPALLRSADLVVCTPWTATFGIAAVEAMACGVAVVANGVGGLADTVVHGVTGVQVPPRRPRDLASALRTLLNQRTTREHQGAAGRDRAATRYSWTFVAKQTAHVYQQVLNLR
ncbi:glycosyltransferase family 4 protein [Actinophytocola sp.]|uniref:glycosyltransferase family 4 protein n=1 Tax=Actinophytocola sp. TaxID=1872138 RepID=UPI00389B0FFA